jgi:hypothetical protein
VASWQSGSHNFLANAPAYLGAKLAKTRLERGIKYADPILHPSLICLGAQTYRILREVPRQKVPN